MNLILYQLCFKIASKFRNNFVPSLFPKLFGHNSCMPSMHAFYIYVLVNFLFFVFINHYNCYVANLCVCSIYIRTYKYKMYASRLTIVSREAKKKQRPLSELFTWTTTKKLGNAQAKPP